MLIECHAPPPHPSEQGPVPNAVRNTGGNPSNSDRAQSMQTVASRANDNVAIFNALVVLKVQCRGVLCKA